MLSHRSMRCQAYERQDGTAVADRYDLSRYIHVLKGSFGRSYVLFNISPDSNNSDSHGTFLIL